MPEPTSCVVVVVGLPGPAAEAGLRGCEAGGVPVWRVAGGPGVDVARSRAASDALRLGYDTIVWADPRAGADPAAVRRLLAAAAPVVRDTTGLTLTRRAALDAVRIAWHLPECRGPGRAAFVPYFQPIVRPAGGGPAEYLTGDAAFEYLARRAGVEVAGDSPPDWDTMADPADLRYDRPEPPADVPRRLLVLCALPRAGAGLLARLLRSAGIGVPHPYFHPAVAAPLATRWEEVAAGDRAGYAAAVARHRTTANGVTAVVAEWWQFAHTRAAAPDFFGPAARYVYVTRGDTAAQAVSLHLAHATGVWGPDGAFATPGEPPGRLADLAGVREAAAQVRQDDRDWRDHFAAAGIDPLTVRFEELVSDQTGAVRRVAKWLGLADEAYRLPDPEPRDVRRPAAAEVARADLYARFLANAAPVPDKRPTLRGPATPLPPGFPRIRVYVLGDPAAVEGLTAGLPVEAMPPPGVPSGGVDHYRRALEAAAADGCDYAVILGDGVRLGRHLGHNLTALPILCRDQCDYLGLFLPTPEAVVWERHEPHLGYRLARVGDRAWGHPWAARTAVLSGRLVRAVLARWDSLTGHPADRVAAVGTDLRARAWYPVRAWAEDPRALLSGLRIAHHTDFDPDFRLEVGPGFQPPEEVPGWLTRAEGELLWRVATGRHVLVLGTGRGRATVCAAQSARAVVSVGGGNPAEAAEWARRYGAADRVEFRRGTVAAVCPRLTPGFGLVLADTEHDAASVARDVAAARALLTPGGLLAVHDYQSPRWPAVREVVDGHAARLGWARTARAGHLAVFQV